MIGQAVLGLILLCGVGATLLDDHMGYEDIQSYNFHPCKRQCVGDPPMVCEYDFLVEHYHTLSTACYDCPFTKEDCYRPHCVATDGSSRGVITVNRMIPGPGIHVCEGDTIRVRVHNKLEMNEGITIHWHGIHQRGTPYMDGANMVTQCPIPARTSFTYTFDASTPGTHMWHAHSGYLSGFGVIGNLVVRQPPEREVHIHRYDFDLPQHTLMVSNWWSVDAGPTFILFPTREPTIYPLSILVNGRGMMHQFHDPKTGENVTTPVERILVRKGKRYRMRLANTGIDCPIKFSIDNHMITVIASDGSPVEPMEVESVTIFDGERYDIVLEANQNISNYLVRFLGVGDCAYVNASQIAVLRYGSAPENVSLDTPAPELKGKELNPLNTPQSATKIPVTELKALVDDDPAVTRHPDKKIVVGMDFHIVNNPRFHNLKYYPMEKVKNVNQHVYTVQWNNISMRLPPAPPLTQYNDIPQDMFCNKDTLPGYDKCGGKFCECLHVYKVALGDVVEVVMVDEGQVWDSPHPTHLHGHQFRVVAMGKLGDSVWTSDVEKLDKEGGITRNLDRPPRKDTVNIPDGGYTIIRFHANNPGFWLFHCHLLYHVELGMGFIFQVGDVWEFPRRPARFPQCGSWDGYTQSEELERKRETEELRHRVENLESIVYGKAEGGSKGEAHKVNAGLWTLALWGIFMCFNLLYGSVMVKE